MNVLAISHAYVEPYTRAGLVDPSRYPDIVMTIVVPASAARRHPEGFKKLRQEFPSVHALPGFFNFHQAVRGYGLRLFTLLRNLRPDVIFVNDEPWSTTAFQIVLANRLLNLNAKIIVYTCENLVRKYPVPFRYMERYVLNHVDVVATLPVHEAAEILRHKGYSGATAYVPLTVQTNVFNKKIPVAGATASLDGRFCVGYVGRLVPEKGLHLLLEALTRLPETIQATIIGHGPDKRRLTALVRRLNINHRVAFVDQIFNDALPDYLNRLHTLVLPSLTTRNWKEQFGRVLIEAMACELPVIGSSSGEIPMVIGDGGLVFKENDSADLAAKIRQLSEDPSLYAACAVRARARVCTEFDAAVVMQRTAALYRDVANAPAR